MRAALFLIFLPLPAFAQCPAGTEIFSCPAGSKTIQICQTDTDAIYRFGPKGSPTLTLSVPITKIDTDPWSGIGWTIWSEATFHNAGHSYTVWTSFNKADPKAVMEGGVTVTEGDKLLMQIACDAGKVSGDTSGLSYARADTGQCWHLSDLTWKPFFPASEGWVFCQE